MDTSDTLRTHTGRHMSALTCTWDPVYVHKRVCGSATVSPLAARDRTRSMLMPSHGEEVQDGRVAAVEQHEADEEAILDALDVVQPSIDSTHLRTGGARRVSNT